MTAFALNTLLLAQRQIVTEGGRTYVIVDETESPLGWLARRRGRDGRVLIELHQLEAGDRLRADFTRAHLMPRTTSDWSNPLASGRQAVRVDEPTSLPKRWLLRGNASIMRWKPLVRNSQVC